MDKNVSISNRNQDIETASFVPPLTPLLKRIGFGTGVSVYHLDRSPVNHTVRSPWALKKVNVEHKANRHFQDRIDKEAEILMELKHPNIVGFRGFSKTADGRRVLAMEECTISLGDKLGELSESGAERLSMEEILKVVVGVAKALQYLHCDKGLLHGDIKSHNVLIKNNFDEVKLCDFGVSVKLATATVENYVGTGAWSAPETLTDGPITDRTDIFSLGLVIWEMLTLRIPNVNLDISSDTEDFDNSIDDTEHFGETPALPAGLPASYGLVVELYDWCTRQKYSERPSARELLLQLADRGVVIDSSPPVIILTQ